MNVRFDAGKSAVTVEYSNECVTVHHKG